MRMIFFILIFNNFSRNYEEYHTLHQSKKSTYLVMKIIDAMIHYKTLLNHEKIMSIHSSLNKRLLNSLSLL